MSWEYLDMYRVGADAQLPSTFEHTIAVTSDSALVFASRVGTQNNQLGIGLYRKVITQFSEQNGG